MLQKALFRSFLQLSKSLLYKYIHHIFLFRIFLASLSPVVALAYICRGQLVAEFLQSWKREGREEIFGRREQMSSRIRLGIARRRSLRALDSARLVWRGTPGLQPVLCMPRVIPSPGG